MDIEGLRAEDLEYNYDQVCCVRVHVHVHVCVVCMSAWPAELGICIQSVVFIYKCVHVHTGGACCAEEETVLGGGGLQRYALMLCLLQKSEYMLIC